MYQPWDKQTSRRRPIVQNEWPPNRANFDCSIHFQWRWHTRCWWVAFMNASSRLRRVLLVSIFPLFIAQTARADGSVPKQPNVQTTPQAVLHYPSSGYEAAAVHGHRDAALQLRRHGEPKRAAIALSRASSAKLMQRAAVEVKKNGWFVDRYGPEGARAGWVGQLQSSDPKDLNVVTRGRSPNEIRAIHADVVAANQLMSEAAKQRALARDVMVVVGDVPVVAKPANQAYRYAAATGLMNAARLLDAIRNPTKQDYTKQGHTYLAAEREFQRLDGAEDGQTLAADARARAAASFRKAGDLKTATGIERRGPLHVPPGS